MGYRIEYQPVRKIRGREQHRSRLMAFTALFFLLFLVLTHVFWPEGAQMLQRVLIPGDPAVTAAALDGLCDQLRSGAGISEAAIQFCRQILSGDALYVP